MLTLRSFVFSVLFYAWFAVSAVLATLIRECALHRTGQRFQMPVAAQLGRVQAQERSDEFGGWLGDTFTLLDASVVTTDPHPPRAKIQFLPGDALFADVSGPLGRSTTQALPESHADAIRPDAFLPGAPLARFSRSKPGSRKRTLF